MTLAVIARYRDCEVTVTIGNTESFAKRYDHFNPAFFMAVVIRPFSSRRCALAQIMNQNREASLSACGQQHGLPQGHQHVDAGVNFGMPACWLRNAEQSFDFRIYDSQGTDFAHDLEEYLGV